MDDRLYGGIEGGGTKFVCAIGSKAGKIVNQAIVATKKPYETLEEVCRFFEQGPKIASLGIGSFGPVELDPSSKQFGSITKASKPGWEDVDIKGFLENRLGIAASIDTDVNCAAIGEKFFGQAFETDNFVYITVGTGIGASLMADNKLYRGASHIEAGHMRISHEPFKTGSFQGICEFHGDCLEGVASGYAMQQRWGMKAEENTDPDAWKREADYLATAITNLIMTLHPKLFILGGGVIKHPGLLEDIRLLVGQKVNGYLELPPLEAYIVRSNNQDNAVLGAIKLAP